MASATRTASRPQWARAPSSARGPRRGVLWTAGVVLALSAALLVVPARAAPALGAAVVAGTIVVAALGFLTGVAGGELVYLRGAAAVYAPVGNAPLPGAREARHRDDD